DNYNGSLLSGPIDAYEMSEDDELRLTWGALPDESVYGTQITYEDQNGDIDTLFVSKDDPVTYIADFIPQTIEHRTLYLPTSLAIDTFYTESEPLRIK